MPTARPMQEIDGVLVLELVAHADARGTFVETWRKEWMPGAPDMVQANRSDKIAGSVVAFHYHRHQADYWYVQSGTARVFLHDLRPASPTEGVTVGLELSGSEHRGIYIPPGVAHGFAAVSDLVLLYMVDRYYDPADELGLAWDDPEVHADWGIEHPVLSGRDANNPRRADIPADLLPGRWVREGT